MFVDVVVGAIAAYIVYRQETLERRLSSLQTIVEDLVRRSDG